MTVVAPGVYQFTTVRDSYVRLLNSVAIVGDDGVLVFDTGTRPSAAANILAQIRQLTDKPVRYIVNSHGHPDHWSGNGVFASAFPGSAIIASSPIDEQMHRMAPVWGPRFTTELESRRKNFLEEQRTGKRPDGSLVSPSDRLQDSLDLIDYASLTAETVANVRVFPSIVYTDSLSLRFGGRNAQLMCVAGDALGTTMLWLPGGRVLLTGDAVSYPMPYVGHPRQHIETLDRVIALAPVVIVPGHGPAFHDTSFVALERRWLRAIVQQVDSLRSAGVNSVDEMQRRVTAGEFKAAFANGDPDLEARYAARVRDVVGEAFADSAATPAGTHCG